MPSPLGHGLAGVAAGWLIDPPGGNGRGAVRYGALLAAVATAPDLDLLVGAHSGPSHGLGVALAAGVVAWLLSAVRGWKAGTRFGCAIAAAYASHTLLDWLGSDTAPPIGIMALWPFSRDYYESRLHVFMAISRRYWLPEFWTYNVRAIARELLILVPAVLAAAALARRPRSRRDA